MSETDESGLVAEKTITIDKNKTDFGFLPQQLIVKCKHFIESYHDLHGYSSIVDILWHPEVRNALEINEGLKHAFKKATTCRSVKRTDQGFVVIATALLSMELMASGFAGWAHQFPIAHRKASALLTAYVPSGRTWLMDRYLYPRAFLTPGILLALSPPDSHLSDKRDYVGPSPLSEPRSPERIAAYHLIRNSLKSVANTGLR